MNGQRADDLFEQSTMTFGEHLEEFRVALAKALIGLLVGVIIAIPFSPKAVDFVKGPLEKALRRVHLKKANMQLTAQGDDTLSPESWTLLEDRGMVPDRVQLDVDEIVDELAMLGVAEPTGNRQYLLTPDDLADQSSKIAATIVDGSTHWSQSAAKTIWEQLTVGQQKQIRELDRADGVSDVTASSPILAILNGLITNPSLASLEPFNQLDELFEDEGPRKSVARLKEGIEQGNGKHERLNRLLLAAALDTPSLATRPRVIDVRMWQPPDIDIQALNVQEPFMILVKAVLVLGLIISSPWVFFQIWNFVASGLYPHERKHVYTYLPFSLGLFFAGAALAFVFVFQPVLDFLFSFNLMLNIDASPRISEWVSFVLFLPIGFGLSFQLPLVMLLLERIGVMNVEAYMTKWRIAVLVIFVLSMILTPSDPTSMLLMGVPLTFLYFGGIALCKYLPRSQSPLGPAEDPK